MISCCHNPVSMVHMTIDQLAEIKCGAVERGDKAAMVSNLLVVLCGERGTQPSVNTAALYG